MEIDCTSVTNKQKPNNKRKQQKKKLKNPSSLMCLELFWYSEKSGYWFLLWSAFSLVKIRFACRWEAHLFDLIIRKDLLAYIWTKWLEGQGEQNEKDYETVEVLLCTVIFWCILMHVCLEVYTAFRSFCLSSWFFGLSNSCLIYQHCIQSKDLKTQSCRTYLTFF